MKIEYSVKYNCNTENKDCYSGLLIIRLPVDNTGKIVALLRSPDVKIVDEQLDSDWGYSDGDHRKKSHEFPTMASASDLVALAHQMIDSIKQTLALVKARNEVLLSQIPDNEQGSFEV